MVLQDNIIGMSDEEFERHKESVILRKSDIPSKLNRKATRVWNEEIYTRQYNFDRIQEELQITKTIDIKQIHSFYQVRFSVLL